jgi:hypothetical protein
MHHPQTRIFPNWGTRVASALSLGALLTACSGSENSSVPAPASAINAYKTTTSKAAPGAAGAASDNGANTETQETQPAPPEAPAAGPSSSELSGPLALTERADAGPPRPSTQPAPTPSADSAPPPGGTDDGDSDDDESDDDESDDD